MKQGVRRVGFWNREILAKMLADKVYICLDAQGRFTICDNSIDSPKIKDGGILTADIADGAITTAKIADNAVSSSKIADGAVTTAKIADGAVTLAKIEQSVRRDNMLLWKDITPAIPSSTVEGDSLTNPSYAHDGDPNTYAYCDQCYSSAEARTIELDLGRVYSRVCIFAKMGVKARDFSNTLLAIDVSPDGSTYTRIWSVVSSEPNANTGNESFCGYVIDDEFLGEAKVCYDDVRYIRFVTRSGAYVRHKWYELIVFVFEKLEW